MMASDVAHEVTLLRKRAAALGVDLDTTVRDQDVQVRFRSGREKNRFFDALQEAADPLYGDWWDWPRETPVDWWRSLKLRIPLGDLPQVVEYLRSVRAVQVAALSGRRRRWRRGVGR